MSHDEPPSEAVVTAVADATDRSPLEMEPLFEAVDPDALDALFRGGDAAVISVSFLYAGFEVTVSSDEIRLDGTE